MLFVVAEEVQLNWSKWIRQTHRWLSIVFTVRKERSVVAKVRRGRLSAAAREKISLAQKARWAKTRNAKAAPKK
jgi:hypothetical protein